VSYYSVFGLPHEANTFDIDNKLLKNRFLAAQRVCHPDVWSGRGDREQNIAAMHSSLVNKAYETLQSPLRRAEYLLKLEGADVKETDKLYEQDLISEVIEARMEIEEAEDESEVEAIRAKNKEKMDSAVEQLRAAFAQRNIDRAKQESVRLKYWHKVEKAAQERLHET
jgi:molecular chaperone HscB